VAADIARAAGNKDLHLHSFQPDSIRALSGKGIKQMAETAS